MNKNQSIIEQTLTILSQISQGQNVLIPKDSILHICKEVKRIIKEQQCLLRLRTPITIFGDIHGQYSDMLNFFKKSGKPPETQMLFLGDYVDRGKNSIEVLMHLFCLKIMHPNSVWMLRGNHECREISRLYGFYDECCSKYNEEIWKLFNDIFDFFPIAAVISERMFCVHGGLSPLLSDLNQIESMQRPIEIPERGLIVDLLWSDPLGSHDGWRTSERGTSFTFGPDVVDSFLAKNEFDLVCRAHQVIRRGSDFPYFPNNSTLTIFSAPNYCGEYDNSGAILEVDRNLNCNFITIDPPAPPEGSQWKSLPDQSDYF